VGLSRGWSTARLTGKHFTLLNFGGTFVWYLKQSAILFGS